MHYGRICLRARSGKGAFRSGHRPVWLHQTGLFFYRLKMLAASMNSLTIAKINIADSGQHKNHFK